MFLSIPVLRGGLQVREAGKDRPRNFRRSLQSEGQEEQEQDRGPQKGCLSFPTDK